MAKPHMRVTYKDRDGKRHTIGTVWPSRSGKSFNLQPVLETKEGKYGPEMNILDAFKAAYVDKSGFVDFYTIEDRGTPQPKPQEAASERDWDDSGSPF